jgi:hypothetical protein
MLNERIYDSAELGITSPKIKQEINHNRLTYKDVFDYVCENDIQGYVVIANSDIFFDHTLDNLAYSDIHISKKMFAQLRYEYNPANPANSQICGPRYDSQDAWIFHTNYNVEQSHVFDFYLGTPGCDNKIAFLCTILGYEVINDPAFIKTYHYHTISYRRYNYERINPPYTMVIPYGYELSSKVDCFDCISGGDRKFPDYSKMSQFKDNDVLYAYILSAFESDKPFIIPRIPATENRIAHIGDLMLNTGIMTNEMNQVIQGQLHPLKTIAGILVKNSDHVIEYSQKYMEAFRNCELYAGWEKHGEMYMHISQSHDYMTDKFADKRMIWASIYDIFNYIYATPWTHALRGKRVLIISAFADSIMEKIPIRDQIYDGVDLFPGCTFQVIRPPQTQGALPDGKSPETEEYFGVHLAEFEKQLDEIRDTYDIALVSCGGYGNLVCNHIFKSGKSAIYVGGVLQMYFGILGKRWYKTANDNIQLFINEHWSRPKENEKPNGISQIEGGCYW